MDLGCDEEQPRYQPDHPEPHVGSVPSGSWRHTTYWYDLDDGQLRIGGAEHGPRIGLQPVTDQRLVDTPEVDRVLEVAGVDGVRERWRLTVQATLHRLAHHEHRC